MERLTAADRQAVHRSRLHPGMPGRRTPLESVLALQGMAGNRTVSQLVQRYPKAPAPLKPEELVGPVPKPFDAAVSEDPYKKLPESLKTILVKSFAKPATLWDEELDRPRKMAVTMIYNRFQKHGLWGYVSRIIAVRPPTPPIWCKIRVQGDTPSIEFEGDGEGLTKALLGSAKMCHDTKAGAMLHAGQNSFREVSDTDSLHISVGMTSNQRKGKGDFKGQGKVGQFSTAGRRLFDAHIDRISSPMGKDGFWCVYHPQRSVRHIGNEAVPGLGTTRGKLPLNLRIPANIFPDDPTAPGPRPEMFERPEEQRDKAPPSIIGITGHF